MRNYGHLTQFNQKSLKSKKYRYIGFITAYNVQVYGKVDNCVVVYTLHRTLPRIFPGDIRGILGIYHKYTTNIPRPPLGTFVVYPRYSHKIPQISPGDIRDRVYSRYIVGLLELNIDHLSLLKALYKNT